MVRALLDGSKTQTRRVVKPTPEWIGQSGVLSYRGRVGLPHALCPYGQPGDRLWVRETFQYRGASYDGLDIDDAEWFRCYGQGGAHDSWDPEFPDGWEPSRHMGVRKLTGPEEQEGDGITGWLTKRVPGIHMPRWASRISLEITGVRVERLQDISEDDALAEGCSSTAIVHEDGEDYTGHYASEEYQDLWESINGPGSWEANPWVWVIEFKRLEQPA